uniref:Mitochondrial inner membrane protease subunit 2 n=1 Tax=Syphacia muris TaxID=451379 RepID=A0A0N5AGU4_9BILA
MRSHAALKSAVAVTSRSCNFNYKKLFGRIGAAIGISCVPLVIFDVFGSPASIYGSSMEPTLEGNKNHWWQRDLVWVSKCGLNSLKIGNVYSFVPPDDPYSHHIKRLIAREDDVIEPRNGSGRLVIPKKCCWMESDNPKGSKDSNNYGPVNYGLLTGRATHIIWPPSRWQTLENKLFETNSSRKQGFPTLFADEFNDFYAMPNSDEYD